MNYKREREQLNLTAREVAKAAGVSLRRYMLIEAGTIRENVYEGSSIQSVLNRAKKQALAKLEHWNKLNSKGA